MAATHWKVDLQAYVVKGETSSQVELVEGKATPPSSYLTKTVVESARRSSKKRLVFALIQLLPGASAVAIEKAYQAATDALADLTENDSLFFVFDASRAEAKSSIGSISGLLSAVKASNFGALKKVSQQFQQVVNNPALESFVALKPPEKTGGLDGGAVRYAVDNAINVVRRAHLDKADYMQTTYSLEEVINLFNSHPLFSETALPNVLEQFLHRQ